MKPKSLSELRDESSRFGFEAGDAWPRTAREKKHFVDGWTACQDELLKRAEVLVSTLESLIGYERMNNYPEHEVRHTLCVEVPHIAQEALREWKEGMGI